ncbi:MAG TPA: hypothetical protein VI796_07255 [Candidatus Thermoplasmatota archaeon]|nr:hypothetical protein [Candidatus Thermoplasmatota archaeon]
MFEPFQEEPDEVPAPARPPPRRRILDIVEEAPPTPVRRLWSRPDAQAIHRVASRVGLVGPEQEPSRTVEVLRDLALQNGRDAEARLRLYRDIAQNACFDSEPACIRCPLRDSCLYHRSRQAERQKDRSPIRRLWRN